MCGRFLLNSEIDDIVNKYKICYKEAGKYSLGDFYPSQDAAIVLDNNKRVITLAKWGFYNNAERKKDKELDLWLNNNTSLKIVEEILRTNNDNYKFTIEKCEDQSIESINGEHYEQLKMF